MTNQRGKKKVFISYAREDQATALDIFSKLKNSGLEPWIDSELLLPGQEWQTEIIKSMRSSDFVLTVFSWHSIKKSGYVQKELRFALNLRDEKPQERIFLIPIRIDDCDIPEPFKSYHCCDYANGKGFQKIIDAIEYQIESESSKFDEPPIQKVEKGKILVVDDDINHLRLLKIYITKAGYEFIGVESAEEGLKQVNNSRPELIISDIMLEGLDGLDFLWFVRRFSPIPDVPFILITSSLDPELETKGFRSHADDFIRKPIDSSVLLVKIGNLLENYRYLKNSYR